MADDEGSSLALVAKACGYPPNLEVLDVLVQENLPKKVEGSKVMFVATWEAVFPHIAFLYQFPAYQRMKITRQMWDLKKGGSLVSVSFIV
jgi:hypothetical protein